MLAEYDACVPLYSDFGPKAETLVRDVLVAHAFRPHSITHRVKDRVSMERKLNSPEKRYGALAEVTDLLGLRVITYFPDEVDTFARVLLPEFEVEEVVDRREVEDPRQFGYASLHAVVRLDDARRTHLEYRRFADCRFELQIRSILQHAWAEIEHDLGYKTARGIPRELRRRFSRLSGLLELADDEFRSIRDASRAHAQRVEEAVSATPTETAIDQDSMSSFVRQNSRVAELDEALATTLRMSLSHSDSYAGSLAEYADAAGFHTIGEIEASLAEHAVALRSFSAGWLGEDPPEDRHAEINYGISIFHLCYIASAARGDDALLAYTHAGGFSDPEGLANEIREAIDRYVSH